jgi:hypothetical protein
VSLFVRSGSRHQDGQRSRPEPPGGARSCVQRGRRRPNQVIAAAIPQRVTASSSRP